jgi:hypothetical protein
MTDALLAAGATGALLGLPAGEALKLSCVEGPSSAPCTLESVAMGPWLTGV